MTRLVSELAGAELALWVARARGMTINPDVCQPDEAVFVGGGCGDLELFAPHTDWSQGGPLIEMCNITIIQARGLGWVAKRQTTDRYTEKSGPKPLIAAMRALVASVYGSALPDEVSS